MIVKKKLFCHESVPNWSVLVATKLPAPDGVQAVQINEGLEDFGEDITLAKNLHFLPVNFDVAAAVFAVDHGVTDGDSHLTPVPAVQKTSGTDGNDRATLRLFLGRVGKDDSTRGGLFRFIWLNNNTIIQRSKVKFSHDYLFLFVGWLSVELLVFENRMPDGDYIMPPMPPIPPM